MTDFRDSEIEDALEQIAHAEETRGAQLEGVRKKLKSLKAMNDNLQEALDALCDVKNQTVFSSAVYFNDPEIGITLCGPSTLDERAIAEHLTAKIKWIGGGDDE